MSAAWCLLAVFVAVFARAIIAGTSDYIRDQRLAEHIGRIGVDQEHGTVERLVYPQFMQERHR